MSLLIEGIGAPITCEDCDYSVYVGLGNMYCKLACKKEKTDIASKRRADFCPMKEIKEPHGRLGDLDKLKSKFHHSDGDNDTDSAWITAIRRAITQAETIVAAEGRC